jgi:hypothetical protein
MARTVVNLFAFGSRTKGPRLPRTGIDLFPDQENMVGPDLPESANGCSTFADVNACPLTGHYHVLLSGTELPAGLEVVSNGKDVNPESLHPPTHHSIFPRQRMRLEEFIELFGKLPWRYAGKKT